jgi:hypothetical protein
MTASPYTIVVDRAANLLMKHGPDLNTIRRNRAIWSAGGREPPSKPGTKRMICTIRSAQQTADRNMERIRRSACLPTPQRDTDF